MRFTLNIHRYALLILTLATAMLSACHSSRKVTTTSAYKYTPTQSTRKATASSPSAGKLIHEAESWLGTPYKYGGNDRKGVDCSGLVLQVYKNALGIALPRTSREQRDFCPYVSTGSLYPGDLVFFSSDTSGGRVTHVGIFMGDNMMIHASTSKGVIVSDLTTSYYKRNYMGGGQVEQYHAMIGVPSKRGKKQTPAEPAPEVPEIHISQLESPAGFSLTPVDGLPQRMNSAEKVSDKPKTESSAKSKPRPKDSSSGKATTKKTADKPQSDSAKSRDTSSMTPEEARAAVLGSLPEQNITQQ